VHEGLEHSLPQDRVVHSVSWLAKADITIIPCSITSPIEETDTAQSRIACGKHCEWKSHKRPGKDTGRFRRGLPGATMTGREWGVAHPVRNGLSLFRLAHVVRSSPCMGEQPGTGTESKAVDALHFCGVLLWPCDSTGQDAGSLPVQCLIAMQPTRQCRRPSQLMKTSAMPYYSSLIYSQRPS
jgi:hypothetical protein